MLGAAIYWAVYFIHVQLYGFHMDANRQERLEAGARVMCRNGYDLACNEPSIVHTADNRN